MGIITTRYSTTVSEDRQHFCRKLVDSISRHLRFQIISILGVEAFRVIHFPTQTFIPSTGIDAINGEEEYCEILIRAIARKLMKPKRMKKRPHRED